MRRRLPLILAVVLLAAGYVAWSLFSARQAVEEAADAVGDVDVDVSMQGVELSRGAEGRAEWRLKAEGADYLQDEGLVRVDNPRIVYYLEDGGDEVVVTAKSGELNQETDTARLWPDVTIFSGPTTVTADRLDYAGADRDIVLTGDVRIDRPGMVMTAPDVRLDLKTNDISASGGVRAELATGTLPGAKE